MGATRLTPDAVPTIFPNSPAYLSDRAPVREEPEEKRKRHEASHLEEAIRQSISLHEEEDRQNKLQSYEDLLSRLQRVDLSSYWTAVQAAHAVLFLHVEGEDPPDIERSVVVSRNMEVTAFWRKAKLPGKNLLIPSRLDDLRCLQTALDSVRRFKGPDVCDKDEKVKASFNLLFSLLDSLMSDDLLPQEKIETLGFIKEQLELLQKNDHSVRYSAELLIFASILHTISPHAYRFIRSAGKVALPHRSTLMRICSQYNVNPANEQDDEGFLRYVKKRSSLLKPHEKIVTIMVDEIHIQPYFEFKGGSVTGAASNSEEAAKTAHVFMIQSLLSAHKDVAHILPVANIEAAGLHEALRKTILELEKAGLTVIAVITDNNSINRKVMSLFSKTRTVDIVYPHPADDSRPLFYVVDPVHLLKCVRNNWLNQKNPGTCIFFPEFPGTSSLVQVNGASFKDLRDLHASEQHSVSKFGYGLSYKALHPSNIERQNVKLVLKVFSSFVVEALKIRGNELSLNYAAGTAQFIDLILKWWRIVNVKSPSKGRRLRDPLQDPVKSLSDKQIEFLNNFVDWLDTWRDIRMDTGALTTETHAALRLTCYSLVELCRYCLEELNFNYVLLGKFQTDSLEERFGQYRRLSGTNYHISIQQVFESEKKLRLQDSLVLPDMQEIQKPCPSVFDGAQLAQEYGIKIADCDIKNKESSLAVITYIAGFCAHAALKKLPCEYCAMNITSEDREIQLERNVLIENLSRGALKFPQPTVISAVLYTHIVLEQLTSKENAARFHATPKQRELLVSITRHLCESEDFDVCTNGHHPDTVLTNILVAAANTLLKNYVNMKTDILKTKKTQPHQRKVQKFSK